MDKELTKDLMQMLDFNETIYQLARANSALWCGHILRKDKNYSLRQALDLDIKGT